MTVETKRCEWCGRKFRRPPRICQARWNVRHYCGSACSRKGVGAFHNRRASLPAS